MNLTARTLASSAARTTTGNTGAIDVHDAGEKVAILANVTAVSGTSPSMTLSVEWSHDGTNFAAVDGTADSFAAITAASAKVKSFEVKGRYLRAVWTITGTTPSFTFTLTSAGF